MLGRGSMSDGSHVCTWGDYLRILGGLGGARLTVRCPRDAPPDSVAKTPNEPLVLLALSGQKPRSTSAMATWRVSPHVEAAFDRGIQDSEDAFPQCVGGGSPGQFRDQGCRRCRVMSISRSTPMCRICRGGSCLSCEYVSLAIGVKDFRSLLLSAMAQRSTSAAAYWRFSMHTAFPEGPHVWSGRRCRARAHCYRPQRISLRTSCASRGAGRRCTARGSWAGVAFGLAVEVVDSAPDSNPVVVMERR